MAPKRPVSTIPLDKLTTRALESLQPLLTLALDEDIGPGDLTTDVLIGTDVTGSCDLLSRVEGVVAGLIFVQPILNRVDFRLRFEPAVQDGDRVAPNGVLGHIAGPIRPMLTVERTMLNFLQNLSGIATLARKYVETVADTGVVILDTRKTMPGWRYLEKYAVRMGGAVNHRTGLYDGVLIKDNHLAIRAPDHVGETIAQLVREARLRIAPEIPIHVEIERIEYLDEILASGPDVVLLDNMEAPMIRAAVEQRDQLYGGRGPALEASGGINLTNIRAFALTGVDRISVGALTHSAPNLDISMELRRG
jgi:nicotinate-nucleotide pyrophosphorylase (carboxylating)